MFHRWITCFSLLGVVLLVLPVTTREGQGIHNVTVGANMSRYTGPCPAHIRFTANVYVDRFPMAYNYEWERSDGAKGGERVVRVNNQAQEHLIFRDDWTLGARGTVWERLRVRSGNGSFTSLPARVVVECH